MNLRYFGFESMCGIDENNRVKIEFATDIRSNMNFNLSYSNVWDIKSIFSIISHLTILRGEEVKKSLIAYKDWYTNELIKKITSDRSFYEKQSAAKKEVLQEAVQRRDKLKQQIGKAMTFYEDNKHKIDQMEQVRADYQKVYPGPMVIITKKKLILENVTEYHDIYYQLALDLPENEQSDNFKEGYGWLEFSFGFSQDIEELHNLTSDNVILTNTKPRSDIRVIRRGDKQSSYQFQLDEKYFEGFLNSPLYVKIPSILNQSKFTFTKSEVFTIIDQISNRFSDNSDLELLIRQSPKNEFGTRIHDDGIIISVDGEEEISVSTKFNSTVILSIASITHLISELEIQVLDFLFGVNFVVTFNGGRLFFNSNTFHSTETRYLRKVIRNNLDYITTGNPISLTNQDISGNTIVTSFGKFSRSIDYEKESKSHRERTSNILLSVNNHLFSVEDKSIQYSNDVNAEIILNEQLNPTDWNCDCGNANIIYKCPHLIALFLYGYKEAIFHA